MPAHPPDRRSLAMLVAGLLALGALSYHRLVLAPTPAVESNGSAELAGPTMGTTWSARLGPESPVGPAEARALIVEALDTVEEAMSTYREDSEVSRLSRQPVGDPLPLGEHTLAVLRAAREISEQSGGAFDVTVGPLVALWGFGADAESAESSEPSAAAVAAARARVGYEKLRVDAGSATRTVEGLRVDLSAIAKGYAVDLAAEALEAAGVRSYLLEVGGELRVAGERAPGDPWRVGIEAPREDGTRAVHRVVMPSAGCVATSGNYRNFRDTPSGRVSHTIDPRVGRPIPRAVASVSVVHPRCVMADGWATALGVLGREEGLALAEREGLAVLMLVYEGSALREYVSPAFGRVPSELGARSSGSAPTPSAGQRARREAE